MTTDRPAKKGSTMRDGFIGLTDASNEYRQQAANLVFEAAWFPTRTDPANPISSWEKAGMALRKPTTESIYEG
jgi:hypothetical protein